MYETLSEALADEQTRCEFHACTKTEELCVCDDCKRTFCWQHCEDHSSKFEDSYLCFECEAKMLIEAEEAPVEVPAAKPVSRAKQIKSLMEDSGYSRTEAATLVDAGFGEVA